MAGANARGWPVLTGLLRTYLRPYRRQVSLVVVLTTIQAAGNLYLPILNAEIINGGVVKGDVAHIWRTGGLMLAIAVALSGVAVAAVYGASRVSLAVGANMRAALYRRLHDFSARELNRFGISSLITRNINDVQQIQLFLQATLTLLLIAIIMSAGAVILAVSVGPALSLVLLVTLPLMALTIGGALVRLAPLFRSVQVKIDRINEVLREQIAGVRVIRAFLRTHFEQERYREANVDLTGTALQANRILAVLLAAVIGITSLSTVGIIWFGGRLVGEGTMQIGNLTAFLIYVLQILLYTVIAVMVVVLAPRAVASAERIREVISTVPAITDPPRPVLPTRITGAVEFRHVTFGYPGSERPVLNDLSFSLPAGQTSAIIGGTGSGKSTVLHLIMRFFDVTGGAVLVNGVAVREQRAEPLRATTGLVPQVAYLFAGTVGSNLRLGLPEATDEQLWRALEVAQARDFVASMPGLLDARIDQGGANVSGGQRQRLSIARALVRRPHLYLFDDCFSALDANTDARLRAALQAETADATVIVVAQRVSTIMHADQIIVLDAGRVAGIGTHRHLLATCASYQEIVASQLGEGVAA